MFKIYDGRQEFYQWDLDRKIIVADKAIKQVHFCNRTGECSLIRNVYEVNGMYLADVPNVLLQTDWDIRVYGFDANYTKHDKRFNVVPRTRPENYVYTDVEQKTWEQLEERLDTIEENGVSDEQIETAVNKYLEENDIQVDLTDYYTKAETDAAISEAIENITIPDVEPGEVDLSDYYTKSEVDQKVADAAPDLTEYAKKTDIPDVSGYALKTDIPDTTGFTTMAAVEEKGYQTEAQVLALIAEHGGGTLPASEEGEF